MAFQLLYNQQMSDIDLKEPIFQDELALSQDQSPPANRQNQHLGPQYSIEPNRSSHQASDLLRSGHRSYRFSETTASKRSSPLKVGHCLLRSTDNSSNQPMNPRSKENENRGDFSFLSPINESQVFQCQHRLYSSSPCQVCKGTGFVKGDSNLVKFFEYIISFKLRLNQSYTQKTTLQKKKKTQINTFCQEFYNKETENDSIRGTMGTCSFKANRLSQKPNNGMTSSYSMGGKSKQAHYQDICRFERNSYCDKSVVCRASNEYQSVKVGRSSYLDRASYKSTTRKCNKSDVMEQLSTMLVIHQNYHCDLCQAQPIIGPRFHCNDCEDYDLCQQCYFHYDHKHLMEKIEKNGKGKQLQNIIMMLVEPSRESMGRVSLRPPPTIDMEPLSGKTTKSAIR